MFVLRKHTHVSDNNQSHRRMEDVAHDITSMGNTITMMTDEQKNDVMCDILLGGDTQMITDDGTRFILIEANVMPEFDANMIKYFAFKFVYNKENVYLLEFAGDEEMLAFYERQLNLGFRRRPNVDESGDNPEEYYPRWIKKATRHPSFTVKCQVIFKDRLMRRRELILKNKKPDTCEKKIGVTAAIPI